MNASAMLASIALILAASTAASQAQQAQPPATPPPAPAAPATPPPPVPFPQGANVAYVNLQGVMSGSADGKAAQAKLQTETKKKSAEAEGMMKTMQANQQKLQTTSNLMTAEARAQLEKDIEKQMKAGERFEQDAQAELQELQRQLQEEYNKKLFPVLEQMAKDMNLNLLFSVADSGLIWARPGLDLTAEAIKRMDAAPTPKPTPAPAKPATPPAGGAKPPAKP
jgi:Skp family chaperone for outer membrane proteins